jgi:hypothetical protein
LGGEDKGVGNKREKYMANSFLLLKLVGEGFDVI